MASVALVPRAEQDIRTALNVLALNFSLNDKVVEELLKVGVRNLEEFRFLFEDEAKVGAFVAKIGLGDEATIQTARLRRAWTATRVGRAGSIQSGSGRLGLALGGVGIEGCQAGVLAALPP